MFLNDSIFDYLKYHYIYYYSEDLNNSYTYIIPLQPSICNFQGTYFNNNISALFSPITTYKNHVILIFIH